MLRCIATFKIFLNKPIKKVACLGGKRSFAIPLQKAA